MTLQAWASHRTCRVSNHSLVVETIPLNLLHEQHTQTTDSAGYGDVPLSWRGTPPGSWSSLSTRVVFCHDPIDNTIPRQTSRAPCTIAYWIYAYWSVNRLGYCISITIAVPGNARVKISIDTYLFDQYVQRSSVRYLFLWSILSEKLVQQAVVLRTGMWDCRPIPTSFTNKFRNRYVIWGPAQSTAVRGTRPAVRCM